MRVSFDLDEVLFVDPNKYDIEKPLTGLPGILFKEKLRKGTVELIHELQKRGFEVWIYTSSCRSELYLKRLFGHYGIKFDGIVNAERHNKEVQANRKQRLPQKMPTHYQISLHIDDEDNIIKNSHSFGYRAYRVYEPDDKWVHKVLAEAERVRGIEKLQRAQAKISHNKDN